MIADKWEISRRAHGGVRARIARTRHRRASTAAGSRTKSRPLAAFATDETPRRGTTLEAMADLKPLHRGRQRSPPASPARIADASAALLIASASAVKDLWTQTARAHPSPFGARRRPGVDADRADPGHAVCTGQEPA